VLRRHDAGSVVVDLQATQSPTSRGRGIGRYATAWANAIERVDGRIVSRYLLSPDLPPPGDLGDLARSGKVGYRDDGPFPAGTAIYHSLSPLDIALRPTSVWPEASDRSGIVRSAMVYDLIPAKDPEVELVDPVARRKYRLALEVLRHLDAAQTLSSSVAADLDRADVRLCGGVTVIGAAPDARFVPPADRSATAAAVTAVLGCASRYVYVPTGSHPRKNNERVVAAFASLPESVRGGRQLLLSGAIDDSTRVHYDAIADRFGASGCVVVSGYLTDEMALRCFQGAELVCFPSLSEGFGLPIIEAYATSSRVIASDRAPFDEYVRPEGRFDPMEVASISSVMTSALEGSFDLSSPLRPIERWDDVADRSIGAFEKLLNARSPIPLRRSSRRPRRRVAFVSPLPPAATGVAGYSAKLIDRIAASGKVDLDCYWDGQVAPTSIEGIRPARHVRSLERVEALIGAYDDVIFTLGNSHHHLGALDVLLRRGGTVIAHDIRLTNLYRHRYGDPGRSPHRLEQSIRAMYGPDLPMSLGHNGELAPEEIEQFGLLMTREAAAAADAFFVNSRTAVGLGRIDAGADAAEKFFELPFAVGPPDLLTPFAEDGRPAPGGLDGTVARTWGSPPSNEAGPLIAAFGIVDPVKLPTTLIDAVGALARVGPPIRLAIVGPISDALAVVLGHAARDAGISDCFVLSGPLSPRRYDAWMRACTVAVQLRSHTNGEASATIGECLALGVPTVASGIGWASELPRDTVELVPARATPEVVAHAIGRLLGDGARRRALGEAGKHYAERHTFTRVARELLGAIERQTSAAKRSGPRPVR
jgi:glycosyltransferase involved in cell wall biosynthesis